MKKRINLLIIFAAMLIISASCVKKSNPPVAGIGGTATLVLHAQHHSLAWPIDTLVLYIKYNATEAPTNLKYDDSTTCVCADSIVTCTFTNLKNGNYYVANDHGYDSSRFTPLLTGAVNVTITQQNATTTTNIPVSE